MSGGGSFSLWSVMWDAKILPDGRAAPKHLEANWHLEIKNPPGGGALMCLLFSVPEGVAEQGLCPLARAGTNP